MTLHYPLLPFSCIPLSKHTKLENSHTLTIIVLILPSISIRAFYLNSKTLSQSLFKMTQVSIIRGLFIVNDTPTFLFVFFKLTLVNITIRPPVLPFPTIFVLVEISFVKMAKIRTINHICPALTLFLTILIESLIKFALLLVIKCSKAIILFRFIKWSTIYSIVSLDKRYLLIINIKQWLIYFMNSPSFLN